MIYPASDTKCVAVIGFGTMELGIVQNFAESGVDARVVDKTQELPNHGMRRLKSTKTVSAEEGLVSDPDAVLHPHYALYI